MLGLFRIAMSQRSASYKPRQAYREPRRCLTSTGVNFRLIPPIYSALHGYHYFNRGFTWSAKLAVEK